MYPSAEIIARSAPQLALIKPLFLPGQLKVHPDLPCTVLGQDHFPGVVAARASRLYALFPRVRVNSSTYIHPILAIQHFAKRLLEFCSQILDPLLMLITVKSLSCTRICPDCFLQSPNVRCHCKRITAVWPSNAYFETLLLHVLNASQPRRVVSMVQPYRQYSSSPHDAEVLGNMPATTLAHHFGCLDPRLSIHHSRASTAMKMVLAC